MKPKRDAGRESSCSTPLPLTVLTTNPPKLPLSSVRLSSAQFYATAPSCYFYYGQYYCSPAPAQPYWGRSYYGSGGYGAYPTAYGAAYPGYGSSYGGYGYGYAAPRPQTRPSDDFWEIFGRELLYSQ